MSDNFTSQFFAWLDASDANMQTVANELNNSASTIAKWRSIGVPKGKQFACQALMEQKRREQHLEEIKNNLVLQPTHAQFTRWNKASARKRQTIEEWAFEGLERMADEYEQSNQLRAVEESPSDYDSNVIDGTAELEIEANSESGGNGTAH